MSLKMFWVKNDMLQEPLVRREKVCHGVGGGERVDHIRYEMDNLRQKQFCMFKNSADMYNFEVHPIASFDISFLDPLAVDSDKGCVVGQLGVDVDPQGGGGD